VQSFEVFIRYLGKKKKPEEATPGFLVELQQTSRKLKGNYNSLYYDFRMFARPETYLFVFTSNLLWLV
jgi:hypothetical protein